LCLAFILQEYQARFESCTKVYSFHFWETPDTSQPSLPAALARTASNGSSSSRRVVSHYGSRPYDALFEGYFLEPAAAKAYLALYQPSHKAPPYSKDIFAANCDYLADKVSRCRVAGTRAGRAGCFGGQLPTCAASILNSLLSCLAGTQHNSMPAQSFECVV
jgi:hypothetical protein